MQAAPQVQSSGGDAPTAPAPKVAAPTAAPAPAPDALPKNTQADGERSSIQTTGLEAAPESAPRATANPVRAAAAAEAMPREAPPDAKLAANVLRQVQVAFDPRKRTATIRLDPRELGELTIRIEVEAGHVRAVVRAESGRALELLERHLPELRASLSEQGLETDEFDLALLPERDAHGRRDHDARDTAQRRNALRHDNTIVELPLDLTTGLLMSGTGLDTYA